MLEDNAGLLRNLLALYRSSADQAHAAPAAGVIEYLDARLRDPERGFFFGSQDADEEFYKLPAAEREGREEPYVDRPCYTSWNAMAASAYLEASWTLDRPALAQAALAALEFVWRECRQTESGAMFRYHDGAPHVPGLLGDQAHTARALLDAHEVTGDSTHLDRAEALARLLLDRFADRQGDGPPAGFFDVWDGGDSLGRLAERLKSVQDNAVCAEVFIRLHHLTRDEEDRKSTRLNSSHGYISYAVFCLKKTIKVKDYNQEGFNIAPNQVVIFKVYTEGCFVFTANAGKEIFF